MHLRNNFDIIGTENLLHVRNIEGVHLALWSQLRTRQMCTFREGVHLGEVHLGGSLCICIVNLVWLVTKELYSFMWLVKMMCEARFSDATLLVRYKVRPLTFSLLSTHTSCCYST